MACDESLCSRCAKVQKTCCQSCEIYVTPGDVRRIATETGRTDFHHMQPPVNPNYQDQDDDPAWKEFVFNEEGARRVLKRRTDGDCTFLGPHGCTLSLEVRPLVCRLYPYQYDETGIVDEDGEYCPMHLLSPGQSLLRVLDMNLDDARRWHRQLYVEIRLEKEKECSLV